MDDDDRTERHNVNLNMVGLAVLVAVLTTSLTACEDNGSEPRAETVTISASPQPSAQEPTQGPTQEGEDKESMEALFIETVRDEYPELAGNEESELLLAKSTCKALESGATVRAVFEAAAREANGDSEVAGYLGFVMGVGIAVFCPEYADELISLAEENNA